MKRVVRFLLITIALTVLLTPTPAMAVDGCFVCKYYGGGGGGYWLCDYPNSYDWGWERCEATVGDCQTWDHMCYYVVVECC